MKFNFEVSKLALKDMDEIWEYTAEHWSKQQANKYYKEIIDVIEKICNKSVMGTGIDEVKKGHKRVNIRSHMIIYKIQNNTVFIDRILHQKMDIEKQLEE